MAEDDRLSRHLLERNLTSWGYAVVTAENGEEALAILDGDDPPPLVILDLVMPKVDGLEICLRVRERTDRPYVYLLILTARTRKSEIAAGLAAGADDYVIKPFDADELRARLAVGVRMVSLEREMARKVADLESAVAHIRKLKGLLPICMYCKSVRDDQDYWLAIEEYVHKETGTDFSHGICPACLEKIVAGDSPAFSLRGPAAQG